MNGTTEDQGKASGKSTSAPENMRHRDKHLTGAVVLIVLGILFLAENTVPDFSFADYWPLLLIAIGATLLWRARRSA